MVKKYDIAFEEVTQPITASVTKFGGQPVWREAPAWPVGQSSGKQMQFICQIALEPELFGVLGGRMAYLFMTDGDGTEETWDPNGGENAVILQPGNNPVPTVPQATGPSLYRMVFEGDAPNRQARQQPCELAVHLTPGDDPELDDFEATMHRLGEAEQLDALDAAYRALEKNKIGGTPCFIQSPEYPSDDRPWKLLLQLTWDVPFWINFGDAGTGYAFLAEKGEEGRFLWQCS